MTQPALENLVRIGQLKVEPRNEAECTRMLQMARTTSRRGRGHHAQIHWQFGKC